MPAVIPPIGLGYLGTALRRHGLSVCIEDAARDHLNLPALAQRIASLSPRLIGIQLYSADVSLARSFCRQSKHLLPGTPIVLGGPHPSIDPHGVLDDVHDADWSLRGEAEEGLPLLAKLVCGSNSPTEDDLSQVSGLTYRTEGRLVSIPPVVPDISDLGIPSWDLMHIERYPRQAHGVFSGMGRLAPVLTSRGCPYACTFCAGYKITGRRLRLRSLDHVVAEIEILVTHYGIREIQIEDECFAFDRKHCLEFCRRLSSFQPRVIWSCPNGVRADCLDSSLLEAMRESGCRAIAIGIESGSPAILRHMRKGITLEQAQEACEIATKHGLFVTGLFMLGYPTEKTSDIQNTIKLSLRLPLSAAHFACYLPTPGTEAFRTANAAPTCQKPAYDRFTHALVPYAPPSIGRRHLKWMQTWAYLRFYSQPRVMRLLAHTSVLGGIRYLLRRFIQVVLPWR